MTQRRGDSNGQDMNVENRERKATCATKVVGLSEERCRNGRAGFWLACFGDW